MQQNCRGSCELHHHRRRVQGGEGSKHCTCDFCQHSGRTYRLPIRFFLTTGQSVKAQQKKTFRRKIGQWVEHDRWKCKCAQKQTDSRRAACLTGRGLSVNGRGGQHLRVVLDERHHCLAGRSTAGRESCSSQCRTVKDSTDNKKVDEQHIQKNVIKGGGGETSKRSSSSNSSPPITHKRHKI